MYEQGLLNVDLEDFRILMHSSKSKAYIIYNVYMETVQKISSPDSFYVNSAYHIVDKNMTIITLQNCKVLLYDSRVKHNILNLNEFRLWGLKKGIHDYDLVAMNYYNLKLTVFDIRKPTKIISYITIN